MAALRRPRPLTRREHRTVVLPDFQGVGIGMHLSFAHRLPLEGPRIQGDQHNHASQLHQRPQALPPLENDPRPALAGVDGNPRMKHATTRLTASFEYTGPAMDGRQAQLLHA